MATSPQIRVTLTAEFGCRVHFKQGSTFHEAKRETFVLLNYNISEYRGKINPTEWSHTKHESSGLSKQLHN